MQIAMNMKKILRIEEMKHEIELLAKTKMFLRDLNVIVLKSFEIEEEIKGIKSKLEVANKCTESLIDQCRSCLSQTTNLNHNFGSY